MNIFYFSIFLVALIVFTIIFEQARREREKERERERERERDAHARGSVFVLYVGVYILKTRVLTLSPTLPLFHTLSKL